jgi:hypothetical protein
VVVCLLLTLSAPLRCFCSPLHNLQLLCACNNHILRQALLGSVHIAVLGAGKVGKSQLATDLFGLDMNPSAIVRTEDIGMFKRGRFNVIDFPHWDSEQADKL